MKKPVFKYAIALLSAIMLLPLLSFAFPAGAADGTAPEISVATWSSPAICCNAGETVNLSLCSVQFAAEGQVISGDKITWTGDKGKITSFSPAKAGVYPLTAASGKLSRKVYVVAKDPKDRDYVLYSNDFSADPMAELRKIQCSTGAKLEYDKAGKALVLDASNSDAAYVRVALPEFLDAFGDAVFSARLKLSDQKSSTMWGSMMFRIQNVASKKYYPYMQLCMRYNTTISSGLEVAQRNESNAWNVVKTTGTPTSLGGTFNEVTADFCGKTTNYTVNGKTYITYDSTWYDSGAMGFQVRALKMTVDSVKVCVNPNSSAVPVKYPGGYIDTRDVETGLAQPAAIVSFVKNSDDLEKILDNSPSAAIFTVKSDETGVYADVGGKKVALKDAVGALGGKIIPGFSVGDEASAAALADYLKSRNMRDVYLVSSKKTCIAAVRDVWPYPYSVLDMTDGLGEVSAAKDGITECGCRSVILNSADCTRENVQFLQQRYLTVWTDAGNTETSVAAAINRGVFGLIAADRALAESCMKKFYCENTITREVNIIAHRGVTWMHQENSVEGAVDAFEFGATSVENDVHMSKDGVLIVMHDTTIDRTSDGKGYIVDMTAEEILSHKLVYNTSVDPEDIPTLDRFLGAFADTDKTIVIEYKPSSAKMAQPLAEMIKKYKMENRVVIISFYPAMLAAMRQYIPGISCAWLESTIVAKEEDPLEALVTVASTLQQNNQALSPAFNYVNLAFSKDFVARGITSWLWTVNDLVLVDTYISQGYIGITTNNSQWITYYPKTLTAEEKDGRYTVTDHTHGKIDFNVTGTAEAVIIDDGGTGAVWNGAEGTFTGTSDGTADAFFRYTFRTTSKQYYTLVTDVMKVNVTAEKTEVTENTDTSEGTDGPESTTVPGSESTTAPETSENDLTTVPGSSADAPETTGEAAPAGKGVPVILICAIAAAILLCGCLGVIIFRRK